MQADECRLQQSETQSPQFRYYGYGYMYMYHVYRVVLFTFTSIRPLEV